MNEESSLQATTEDTLSIPHRCCDRCGGNIIRRWDDIACIQCGRSPITEQTRTVMSILLGMDKARMARRAEYDKIARRDALLNNNEDAIESARALDRFKGMNPLDSDNADEICITIKATPGFNIRITARLLDSDYESLRKAMEAARRRFNSKKDHRSVERAREALALFKERFIRSGALMDEKAAESVFDLLAENNPSHHGRSRSRGRYTFPTNC